MSDIKNESNADWKRLYKDALLESDPPLAARLIKEAEQAIVNRALFLHRQPDASAEELKALAYSANFLAELRRVEMNTPKKNSLGQISPL